MEFSDAALFLFVGEVEVVLACEDVHFSRFEEIQYELLRVPRRSDLERGPPLLVGGLQE
jgi:hypothetical protein